MSKYDPAETYEEMIILPPNCTVNILIAGLSIFFLIESFQPWFVTTLTMLVSSTFHGIFLYVFRFVMCLSIMLNLTLGIARITKSIIIKELNKH